MSDIESSINLPRVNHEEIKTICRQCYEKWGLFAQMDMVIEEMSELTKAILKLRRMNGYTDIEKYNRLNEMLEEVVDVEFMLQQAKFVLLDMRGLDKEYAQMWDIKIDKIKGLLADASYREESTGTT